VDKTLYFGQDMPCFGQDIVQLLYSIHLTSFGDRRSSWTLVQKFL